jgi:hypothetical protein
MQRVVVVEHSGRRVHLRAPVNGVLMRDREFVQKLRLLDEYLTSARQSQG